jgi:hypothetical protein
MPSSGLQTRGWTPRGSTYFTECVHGLSAYQDDFVIPGICPLWASSRRQMRHSPNLR